MTISPSSRRWVVAVFNSDRHTLIIDQDNYGQYCLLHDDGLQMVVEKPNLNKEPQIKQNALETGTRL